MSLFNLPVEMKDKPVSEHPWSKSIKDKYSHKIKRAHNTINNIVYPAPKKKRRDSQRIKFTVIGNRVTKEFIYCANMVQGMHKYRSRKFDAPVIKGVTGVEWPHVLNDLKIQYGSPAHCLRSEVAVIYNDGFLGGDQELKDLIETRYLYHLVLNYQKESTQNFVNFVKASGRSCAYLHISIDEKPIGTLIFMLYDDIVPNTCENFLRLCKQTKGGYSGTPVHRIVKDGWIQGGGFALKQTYLTCENFAIPNDKRGVLGMANAGRHIDCSTQFYVLLQPSEWMNARFVAFGQLIDGEKTLQEIEKVNTYYESPTSQIIIHRAGILNLDCKNITINKNTNEYIQKHIEDLVQIADIFYEMLMERVFLEIEFRRIAKLEEKGGESEAKPGEEQLAEGEAVGEDGQKDVRPTKRFVHKKRDVPEDKPPPETRLSSKASKSKSHSRMSSSKVRKHKNEDENKEDVENNEFDVEDYEYEPEEFQYSQVSPGPPPTPKPEKPYYLAMTDVPYPGEVDSNFDLKRFLQGDYCLEYDLDPKRPKQIQEVENKKVNVLNAISEIIESYKVSDSDEDEESSSEEDLDSDDEREIKKYLKDYAEHVSFSGHLVRKIARNYVKDNPIEDKEPHERFTDEEVRRLKLVYTDFKSRDVKKVSIAAEPWETHAQITRRPTGFVRPIDLSKIGHIQDADEEEDGSDKPTTERQKRTTGQRKVSIAVPSESTSKAIKRRQTGFVRPEDVAKILKYKEHIERDDEDDEDVDDDDDSDVDGPSVDDEDSATKLPTLDAICFIKFESPRNRRRHTRR
ncbi:NK-tumor recognition protein-like isoform X2 [Pectinophora gossypiella]|uniref:NK-tumor recognition protein-like isoform X2 n=1 Tax=Pectinophora gossypiella TaxID=13191 RepID=UPI00214F1315|nr:NK-tumor recognition protein-like isoform X2 [Pectinophora gossypiella]